MLTSERGREAEPVEILENSHVALGRKLEVCGESGISSPLPSLIITGFLSTQIC